MYDYFDNRSNLFVTGSRTLLEEAAASADGVLRVFVVNGIEPVLTAEAENGSRAAVKTKMDKCFIVSYSLK